MPARKIPSYHPTRWTVYGKRPTRVSGTGHVHTAGVHKEGITTEGEAVAFAMSTLLQYPAAQIVVVRLDHGRDQNGERHVVARWGDGKSWWE